MNILRNYYKKIIRYDLLNKFDYSHLEAIPELKKIVLNVGCKTLELKSFASIFLSLELIVKKQGLFTKARRSSIFLKVRKGSPTGCSIILRRNEMYEFLLKLLTNVFPNSKDFQGINISNRLEKTNLSFTIKDLSSFKELERQFYLFSKLPPLNITLLANTKSKKELLYLLRSLKFPIIQAVVT